MSAQVSLDDGGLRVLEGRGYPAQGLPDVFSATRCSGEGPVNTGDTTQGGSVETGAGMAMKQDLQD